MRVDVGRAWGLCATFAHTRSGADISAYCRGDRNTRAGACTDAKARSHRDSDSNTLAVGDIDAYADAHSDRDSNVYVDFDAD